MGTYQVVASATINAPASEVYALIADYHNGHPHILPQRYFKSLRVIKGGIGAGTVIDVEMEVFGAKAHYHMTVSEPQPGRILQEEDQSVGTVTLFMVDPISAAQANVSIVTTMQRAPGIKGWIEKQINPPIMRKIYREELQQLEAVMANL